jgi:protein-S-isoprenylcysteine O-methyltransferase Ste14
MPRMTVLIRPAVLIVYVIIVFEILFMISPFALHFYAAYGPTLNVLNEWPGAAWMTKFYLPHFTETTSPILNALRLIGMLLIVSGLTMFFAGAIPVYWSKFRKGRAVTGGLYSFIRHPQYVGLAITGAGAALVWPRFLVLVTLVLMISMYALLAEWEEQLCVSRFGADYRDYQRLTGRFLPKRVGERLPRHMPASGAGRAVLLPFLILCLIAIAVITGFQLRNWSLSRIAAVYDERTAVISTAMLADEDLKKTYQIARSDPRIEALLEQTLEMRFIVYIVPKEWFLPDLPLDEENPSEGHHVPSEFDRLHYKVLFTRARFHGSPPSGVDIIKTSYGRDPLVVAVVDVGEGTVTEIRTPPPHVKWGAISTPMF